MTFLQAIERAVNIVSYTILFCHSTELLVMMPHHHHHPIRLQMLNKAPFHLNDQRKVPSYRDGYTMLGEYWQLTRTNIPPFTHRKLLVSSRLEHLDHIFCVCCGSMEEEEGERIHLLSRNPNHSFNISFNFYFYSLSPFTHVLIHRKGFSYSPSIFAQQQHPQPKEILTGPFSSLPFNSQQQAKFQWSFFASSSPKISEAWSIINSLFLLAGLCV